MREGPYAPCTVALAADLGVDDVESRLAGEIFEILRIEVKPCPISSNVVMEACETKPQSRSQGNWSSQEA